MPYLNLDIDYFSHPKTKRLIRLLGKGSEVLPLRLWSYTAHYFAKDGILTGISAQEIEDECHWWGEAGKMVEAMLEESCTFLNEVDGEYAVHQWSEHNGHISAFSERAKKGAKVRWDKVRGNASGNALSNATSNATSNAPTYLPTKPTLPTKENPASKPSKENPGDDLDDQIRAYLADHPTVLWSRKAHLDIRAMVLEGGWEATKAAMEAALAKPAGNPTAYAKTVLSATKARESLGKAKAPKSLPTPAHVYREDN